MARVKRAVNAQKKRRATLERASGYRGQRSRLYRKAKEQVTHSLVYAYRDRRRARATSAGCGSSGSTPQPAANGMTYNRLIQGLKAAGIEVDRRMLAELAVNDAAAFTALVQVGEGSAAGAVQPAPRPPESAQPGRSAAPGPARADQSPRPTG